MPYIYKPKKKRRPDNNKQLAQKYIYNTTTWKALRIQKLQETPLCEECTKNDRVTLAIEVHHIIAFSTGVNIEQMKYIGFDYNNLMSLCQSCHKKIHKK